MTDTQSHTQLLKPAVVEDRTTLGKVTIWRKVRNGTFPRPVKISSNRIAWREIDIENYIAACETAGGEDAAAGV